MLGGSIKVKTLSGEKLVKIVPTCQPGTVLRIKESGMKNVSGKKGDHFVQINMKLPEDLTVEQKGLLKELDATIKQGGQNGEKREE